MMKRKKTFFTERKDNDRLFSIEEKFPLIVFYSDNDRVSRFVMSFLSGFLLVSSKPRRQRSMEENMPDITA